LCELRAQVERITRSGINISHLDSHYSLHNQPWFFGVLKCLQIIFGIRKVRIFQNIYFPQRVPRSPLLFYKRAIWKFALKNIYRTKTTAGFTYFSTFVDVTQHRQLPHPTLELMVHPGNEKYAEENARLRSWRPEHLPFKVKLINYHEL
jgi:predicted glycoside hydrolase/deacetylase ChbG (UPF0249 family)